MFDLELIKSLLDNDYDDEWVSSLLFEEGRNVAWCL
jgi:hypothetical protein